MQLNTKLYKHHDLNLVKPMDDWENRPEGNVPKC